MEGEDSSVWKGRHSLEGVAQLRWKREDSSDGRGKIYQTEVGGIAQMKGTG